MTPELTVLTLAALLQVLQFVLMAVPANVELGMARTASPRDRAKLGDSLENLLSKRTARLLRAMNNHFEALILFSIASIVISVTGQSSQFTATCAWVYLGARVLYIPAYAFGWVPWRSLIWFVGLFATLFMLIAALI